MNEEAGRGGGQLVARDPKALFGRNLRALRTQRGLNQEELAFASGLDRTYVSSVERGKRNISLLNICRLAEALDTQPHILLDFTSQT